MLFTFESAYAAGTMMQEYFRMNFKVVLVARMLIISAQYCAICAILRNIIDAIARKEIEAAGTMLQEYLLQDGGLF